MVHVLGQLAATGGLLLVLLGWVFFLIAEFREGIVWGLGGLVLPIVNLVFLVLHWARAKNAFFLQLYGLAFMFVGVVALSARLPWPLG